MQLLCALCSCAVPCAAASLLTDTAGSEYSFMVEFFGDSDAFEQIFGKAIFHCMENLEQVLMTSWDAIGCMLMLQLLPKITASLTDEKLPLLSSFFSASSFWILFLSYIRP